MNSQLFVSLMLVAASQASPLRCPRPRPPAPTSTSAVSALLSPSWTSTAPSRVTARVLTAPEPGGVMLPPTTAPARTSGSPPGSPPTPGPTRPAPPRCPTLPWLPWFPPTLTSPPLPTPSLSSRSSLSSQCTATLSTATLSTATRSLSTDPTLGLYLPIISVSSSPRRPLVQDLPPRTPSSSRLLAVFPVPQDI